MEIKYPFLEDNIHPQWSKFDAAKIVEDIEFAISQANLALEAIEQVPHGSANYSNVAKALENSSKSLDTGWSIVDHLSNVMDSPALREAYNHALPKVTDFYGGILLRPKLWQVVKAMAANESGNQQLHPAEQRHIEELVKDFQDCGADLSEQEKSRIKAIDSELAKITQKYSENVLDSTNDWELIVDDFELVKALPDIIRDIARESAESKGHGSLENPKWRFTLHAPSIIPFMKYVEDESLRKQAWEASHQIGNKGEWSNDELVLQILKLRAEKAAISGQDNFSDYVTKRRMAKRGENARQFIQNLKESVAPTLQSEVAELEQFRSEKLGLTEPEKVNPWDVAFWSEKLLQERYDFDDEALRPYFSIDQVIDGMFGLAQKVLGLRFVTRATHVGTDSEQADSIEVWTDNVQYYDVYDADSSVHLGGFYTDWFPRESKRSGAWMDSLRSGVFDKDGKPIEISVGILCGNMTPGKGGASALITHDEVQTVFHEFGHLLHHLCGEVVVKSLNGISVPWDFVEVPSQMMENWCWQRKSLDLFARHFETGKPIADELFEKMLRTRNFQIGLGTMRQLSFGIMDLDLHLDFCAKCEAADKASLEGFIEESVSEYVPGWKEPSPMIYRRFGHLFGSSVGYASGYYSYKWSEVLEADAFSAFLEEGVLNELTGRRFRKAILSVGNSLDPMEAYQNFRGRKPTLEAYLTRSGIPLTELAKEFGA